MDRRSDVVDAAVSSMATGDIWPSAGKQRRSKITKWWSPSRITGHGQPDKVMRNSLLLMTSLALMGAFGFLFWLVVARVYTPAQVGAASTLISAVVLIAFLSQSGVDVMVVRFLAKSPRRNELVTISVCIVALVAAILSAAYVQIVPHYAPELSMVRNNIVFTVAFSVICVLSAVDLFSNAVFVAFRRPEFNVLTDGIIQSFGKLVSPFLLIGAGTYGIVLATGVGYAMATVASLFLMFRTLSLRWVWPHRVAVRQLGSFSSSAYVAQVLNMAPMQLLPLIVLQTLGAEQAGVFFMAFQVANLVYLIAFAVSQTMYSECAHDATNLKQLVRKSARLLVCLLVPAIVVLIAFGPFFLSIIGAEYADQGAEMLSILLFGALAVGMSAMSNSLLKALGRMRLLIIANTVSCVVILGAAQVLAPRGLVWVAVAWIVGNVCAAAVGVMPFIRARVKAPAVPRSALTEAPVTVAR